MFMVWIYQALNQGNEMNTEAKILKYQFGQEADLERLAKIIEKKGGRIWNKKRAYFGDDSNVFVANKVFAQPYDSYIDLMTKELVFTVNEEDFLTEKNTIKDYKQSFIDALKKI